MLGGISLAGIEIAFFDASKDQMLPQKMIMVKKVNKVAEATRPTTAGFRTKSAIAMAVTYAKASINIL